MVKILLNLEPIRHGKDVILLDELNECREVIFLEDSEFMVGYSINKLPYFNITQKNVDIGSYGVTFNVRSHFIYKTSEVCSGYFIRKTNWLKIIND
jgi:myosin-crossreactive antigen